MVTQTWAKEEPSLSCRSQKGTLGRRRKSINGDGDLSNSDATFGKPQSPKISWVTRRIAILPIAYIDGMPCSIIECANLGDVAAACATRGRRVAISTRLLFAAIKRGDEGFLLFKGAIGE
ncbi:hypothetical protein PIB30_060295 [Stylosanthes scabra]|uniref:Uncharacterized protein n=1 Tax=Stylosanthes scabra TaxID=79078 RepID=A0ABU6WK47_9FABA|nr:hypothetical protein [Stylosanthes scabra]